ncbi:hypothetical protein [Micromonospora sagamiensis]|uniref:Flagellar basal body-associated protein FliL n=1 Tax=Micromonospora sagamiensis TaxID=47875 RepID=A0A562WK18_9ACTN|nr:hypothetical protein [Micromonospora sagamiensis]TWJ30545.1 hypothetical protein JD81_04090 [Micromonospora sagamiensis]BCL16424.1 hypothetical protein GCM10017556_41630 [Micromonospora sagamiensis]
MSQPHHPPQPEYGSAHPQPSGAPGYGTGQPYGADPMAAGFPPPPKKKSGVGKVLLIVLAVVLVLCVGGGIAIWATVGDDVGEVVEATKTRVVAPETLNGRPKVTEPGLVAASTQMAAEIKKEVPEATSTVGGFYGDPAKNDLVMIIGVSGLIADPKKELDDAITALSKDLGTTNMTAVEAGPLGGDAKCGDGTSEGAKLGICVWADRGSLGMVIIYFKTGKEAEAEFGTIRSAIEQRD